jgi:recombination associated protein RdgC
MFKNLLVYRLAPDWQGEVAAINDALAQTPFTECGATQPVSLGWESPRGVAHAPLVESVAGQWLMTLTVEQKVVPGSVIRRQVEAMASRIEQETGRAPGKKVKRDLKDQALLELLPMAFTKRASIKVWICPDERLLVIDASSASKADDVLTLLSQALPGFGAQLVNTAMSPAAAMADWLVTGEPPASFTVDRECELKASDGEKPTVRYTRHALDLAEIREHIAAGKQPTRLALTWSGRVSFVLTEAGQIKRLAFLDGVFDKQPGASKDESFDTDAAISTGELIPLIGDLIAALGGEQAFGAVPALPQAAASTVTAPQARPAEAKAPAGEVPPWEVAA